MGTEETQITKEKNVYCSGLEYPLDHPKIYLILDEELGFVVCPYCSKKFILEQE
ncbi:MAG: zinc-finger domain-containing protein [Rickettsiaceae bacterium]|nr:zinc-finger domain-containing protein [Rickettsiaceae bacterium]